LALTTLLFYVGYGSGYAAFYATAIDVARFYATHTELVSHWRAAWKHRQETSPAGGKLTWTKLAPYPKRVGDLLDGGSVYVPIATPADVGIDRILKLQNGFRPPYYPIPISELFLPSDVDRFVADLMRFDLLLVPESDDGAGGARLDLAAYERQQNAWLSGLMLFPVRSHVKREPFIAARSLYRELVKRCRVVARTPGKVLLVTPRGQERIQR
jgi:hypothetical protein